MDGPIRIRSYKVPVTLTTQGYIIVKAESLERAQMKALKVNTSGNGINPNDIEEPEYSSAVDIPGIECISRL